MPMHICCLFSSCLYCHFLLLHVDVCYLSLDQNLWFVMYDDDDDDGIEYE
jgi:hypothetical protein